MIGQIVARPGWASGNALALVVTGTGTRIAESFDGGAARAPVLHIEYSSTTQGPTNTAPVVSAGPDRAVTRPDAASLSGSVTDDGLPNPPGAVTAAWTKVSGPGTVTFGNATAPSTTATFGAAGSYVLRLTGNDGQLAGRRRRGDRRLGRRPGQSGAGRERRTRPDRDASGRGVPERFGHRRRAAEPARRGDRGMDEGERSGDRRVHATPPPPSTTATFGAAGSYVLRLTGNDGRWRPADDVAIAVSDAGPANLAPVGERRTRPHRDTSDAASLSGSVTDDGLPNPPGAVTAAWTKVSGPGTVAFTDAASPSTTATFGAAGSYVLRVPPATTAR